MKANIFDVFKMPFWFYVYVLIPYQMQNKCKTKTMFENLKIFDVFFTVI